MSGKNETQEQQRARWARERMARELANDANAYVALVEQVEPLIDPDRALSKGDRRRTAAEFLAWRDRRTLIDAIDKVRDAVSRKPSFG